MQRSWGCEKGSFSGRLQRRRVLFLLLPMVSSPLTEKKMCFKFFLSIWVDSYGPPGAKFSFMLMGVFIVLRLWMWLSIKETANYTLWERKGTVPFFCMPSGCMHRNNKICGHIFRVYGGNYIHVCIESNYTCSLFDVKMGIRTCLFNFNLD